MQLTLSVAALLGAAAAQDLSSTVNTQCFTRYALQSTADIETVNLATTTTRTATVSVTETPQETITPAEVTSSVTTTRTVFETTVLPIHTDTYTTSVTLSTTLTDTETEKYTQTITESSTTTVQSTTTVSFFIDHSTILHANEGLTRSLLLLVSQTWLRCKVMLRNAMQSLKGVKLCNREVKSRACFQSFQKSKSPMQHLSPARPARAPRKSLRPAQRSPALPPRRLVLRAPRRLLLLATRPSHALLLILFLPLSRTTSACLLPSVNGGSELRTNRPVPSLALPLPISPEFVLVSRRLRLS
jgi:hypothetical protein